MSQVSDVVLANQGFASFRTELNNILGALNTMHVGSSAPSSVATGTISETDPNALPLAIALG